LIKTTTEIIYAKLRRKIKRCYLPNLHIPPPPSRNPLHVKEKLLAVRKLAYKSSKLLVKKGKVGLQAKADCLMNLLTLLSLRPPHPVSPLPHKMTMRNLITVTPLYLHFQVNASLQILPLRPLLEMITYQKNSHCYLMTLLS